MIEGGLMFVLEYVCGICIFWLCGFKVYAEITEKIIQPYNRQLRLSNLYVN